MLIYIIGEGESSIYGAFASKIGSGAAKAGKKFAQSEAGRSATRAAMKGATDAAVKDVSTRYLGDVPEPKPRTSTTTPPAAVDATPLSPTLTKEGEDKDFDQFRRDSYSGTRPPPKPSFFNRFKPNINLKSQSDDSKQPVRKRSSQRKIYKYAAIDKADWESLPRAMTLYNFRGEMKCDLQFRKGQIIHIITKTDTTNDWWEGRIEDRIGIFPANYVKMI